ncbi:nitroreductase family deazaflavin-dependent oxidoreductase [Streptomonospora nanhaiensis]|uniref:Deazaflavin-dependent oxidoreductase (Nitroreductase family) n=1 Tax=Streptomonospora nanhaiensis TaxID=1323731 RepID=A0A853BIU3_9ACTN|nr:nitroreductase family deazaflavin-dependent oxidoreductase [Streptomonospora nanhaiensis]MBV2365021.1 nitroreductase family deazaflavin-dependent oxidoreductase [Streptomonospora nanhaiensis]MBX9389102.1 nitroreductase family deazaflavin-dependent oxidoreductase [Streptomonospora nanhaiensis]NYI94521.1 deazaflavin-dependent oxidoreductase (nitroreductase family) [Streptomonospora nanhaiensis]
MLYGKEHVERYVATDGEEGHDWQGTTTLILTTVGRRSGQRRSTPLIYRTDGDAFVVVASKGGDPDHPLWYKNLLANPEAEIQVKADRYRVRARTADEDEKARLWPRMAATWPQYDEYQTKTERSIPVVVLDPVEKLA